MIFLKKKILNIETTFDENESEEEVLSEDKKYSTQIIKENQSEKTFNKLINSKKNRGNFSKYKSNSSKNSIFRDSDMNIYKINSNNFFKKSNDVINEYDNKHDSLNNQSSNILTNSQINMLTNINNQIIFPLEFFENNFFNLINSVGCKSEAGINFNGNPKINQDSFFIKRNIFGYKNFNIFCVLDGHGNFFLF